MPLLFFLRGGVDFSLGAAPFFRLPPLFPRFPGISPGFPGIFKAARGEGGGGLLGEYAFRACWADTRFCPFMIVSAHFARNAQRETRETRIRHARVRCHENASPEGFPLTFSRPFFPPRLARRGEWEKRFLQCRQTKLGRGGEKPRVEREGKGRSRCRIPPRNPGENSRQSPQAANPPRKSAEVGFPPGFLDGIRRKSHFRLTCVPQTRRGPRITGGPPPQACRMRPPPNEGPRATGSLGDFPPPARRMGNLPPESGIAGFPPGFLGFPRRETPLALDARPAAR